jgi:hypothetical protein
MGAPKMPAGVSPMVGAVAAAYRGAGGTNPAILADAPSLPPSPTPLATAQTGGSGLTSTVIGSPMSNAVGAAIAGASAPGKTLTGQ